MENIGSINILGTCYVIEKHAKSEDDYLKNHNLLGYYNDFGRKIIVKDLSDDEAFEYLNEEEKESLMKETLRHEIIHAFLNESGLRYDAKESFGPWTQNEEMIDWFAIQSPKIFKVYEELKLL